MKFLVILLSLVFLLSGSFFYIKLKYNDVPLSTILNFDSNNLSTESKKFIEDLQFKDFKSAGKHSIPEHLKQYDMPSLIERLFQVKPEFLDIQRTKVLSVEKDSTGKRAKVNLETDIKILNTNELKKPNIILYWKKLDDDKWYLDLASSIK